MNSSKNLISPKKTESETRNETAIILSLIQLIGFSGVMLLMPGSHISVTFYESPRSHYFFLIVSMMALFGALKAYLLHRYVTHMPTMIYKTTGIFIFGLVTLDVHFSKGHWKIVDTIGLLLAICLTLTTILKQMKLPKNEVGQENSNKKGVV